MFTDSREQLVEVSCQLLCVALETNISLSNGKEQANEVLSSEEKPGSDELATNTNLFISYLSRIHRDEVLIFILFVFLLPQILFL